MNSQTCTWILLLQATRNLHSRRNSLCVGVRSSLDAVASCGQSWRWHTTPLRCRTSRRHPSPFVLVAWLARICGCPVVLLREVSVGWTLTKPLDKRGNAQSYLLRRDCSPRRMCSHQKRQEDVAFLPSWASHSTAFGRS